MKIYNEEYFSEVRGITSPKEQKWKFEKTLPALTVFFNIVDSAKISLIEIGSGSGLFLKYLISNYKKNNFDITSFEINKASLKYLKNISPKIKIIIGDISNKTSFSDKKFDLCIAIDVIEHIPDIQKALQEIKRVSKYAIFKIPIEKSFGTILINLLTLGQYRKNAINTIGHINWFSDQGLRLLLKNHFYKMEYLAYTNLGSYQYQKYESLKKPFNLILLIVWYVMSAFLFRISPRTNALIFGDHIIVLVRC